MGFLTPDRPRGRLPTAAAAGAADVAPAAGALTAGTIAAIGARVRALRLEGGWTQKELGDPFSKGYVSQIENGRVAPSLGLLSVIAARLGTSIERLAPEIETSYREEDVMRLWEAAERLERHGEQESELQMLEQATRLAGLVDEPALRGHSLLRYADALRRAGRNGEALEMTTEAFEIFGTGPSHLLGKCCHVAALAHSDRGDLERARSCFEKALRHIPRREVDHSRVVIALSRMLLRAGKTQEARQRAGQAVALSHQHGDGREEARARLLLVEILREDGKPDQALSELAAAREIVRGLQDARLQLSLQALEVLGQAAEGACAEGEVESCLQAAEAAGDDELCVTLCAALVEERLKLGSGEEAANIAGLGIEHARRCRDWQRLARLQARQGLAFAISGETEKAAAAILSCRETYMTLHRPDALRAALEEIRSRLAAAAPVLRPLLETPPML